MTSPTPPPGLALLVIDVQESFLRSLPANGLTLARRCAFAVGAAKLLGVPTAITEHVPAKLGLTARLVCETAAPETKIFAKTAFSAFGAAGLGEWLREVGATHLLMAGLEAPICLYLSVLDALAANFEVTVLVDATGGRRPEDFPAIWQTLEAAGARLLPSETVFYSMVKDSTHPCFREFTALVKQYA